MKQIYQQYGRIVAAAINKKELPADNYNWEALSKLFAKHNMSAILNAVIPKKGTAL